MMSYFKNFAKSNYSSLIVGLIIILASAVSMKGFNLIGFAIIVIGELIYGFGNVAMGRVWSINVEEKDMLIDKGLFKYIRHPLYLGSIIALIGFSIFLKSIPGFILAIIFAVPFFYLRSKAEEELLSKTMKGYKEYMKRTGMFLPKFK